MRIRGGPCYKKTVSPLLNTELYEGTVAGKIPWSEIYLRIGIHSVADPDPQDPYVVGPLKNDVNVDSIINKQKNLSRTRSGIRFR